MPEFQVVVAFSQQKVGDGQMAFNESDESSLVVRGCAAIIVDVPSSSTWQRPSHLQSQQELT